MNKLWELTTTDHAGSEDDVRRRGNVYQIANGYMGYRGTLDEFGAKESVGVTLAGIFDQVGSAWREPVNAPNGAFTEVRLDGVPLSALGANVGRHRQTLHFADARFERETVFRVGGKTLTLRSERFLSAVRPHLGVVRFSVSCDRAAHVTVRTGIDGEVWDLNGPHLENFQATAADGVLALEARTHEAGKRVAVAECIAGDCGDGAVVASDRRQLREFTVALEAGQVCAFTKFFAVFTEQDPLDVAPVEAAIAEVRTARAHGYEACVAEHASEWRRRWERSDVLIEGDDEAQHALRYSLLQLLMVAPVAGSANSIPARALSGQVYKGAVFWDTEMFILPFFLHTDAAKAAELLRYRIKTLDGARRKARTEGPGFRGAFYAWESQDTGDDACSYFNIGDPITGRELRTHFRDKQVHISGDVALAMWRYFEVTGDDSLLLQGGAEVILECARFYFSYAYFNSVRARYEILDVVGPDEYHERVHNNAFTSQVARETFVVALAAVEHLRRTQPAALESLLAKLDIASELPGFADAAARLYVPAPDEKTGVIEQFEGYHQLRDTTIEALKARLIHPTEYLGAGQGLAVPTKIIKQADVVMMLNLFKARYSSAIKQANWKFYEPRTEHGSSLSACAYAMVAAEFGDLEFAYRYFLKTAKIDLEAKYKIHAGTIYIGGSHPAANGGAWMTAIFGFGGVQVDGQRIAIEPRLYPQWRALEFPLAVRGNNFRVRITAEAVTLSASSENRRETTVHVVGRPVVCQPGQTVVVASGRKAGVATVVP